MATRSLHNTFVAQRLCCEDITNNKSVAQQIYCPILEPRLGLILLAPVRLMLKHDGKAGVDNEMIAQRIRCATDLLPNFGATCARAAAAQVDPPRALLPGIGKEGCVEKRRWQRNGCTTNPLRNKTIANFGAKRGSNGMVAQRNGCTTKLLRNKFVAKFCHRVRSHRRGSG